MLKSAVTKKTKEVYKAHEPQFVQLTEHGSVFRRMDDQSERGEFSQRPNSIAGVLP